MIFVDSNIPMYVAGRDHPLREPSRRFLQSVGSGRIDACTSTEVLQEILYRYTALNRRDLAREVYELFVRICPIVLPVTLADTDRAKDLLVRHASVGARDSIHVAVMLNNDVKEIATFDEGFDAFPGIARLHFD